MHGVPNPVGADSDSDSGADSDSDSKADSRADPPAGSACGDLLVISRELDGLGSVISFCDGVVVDSRSMNARTTELREE